MNVKKRYLFLCIVGLALLPVVFLYAQQPPSYSARNINSTAKLDSKILDLYKNHTGGLDSSIDKQDVENAILLGKETKDNNKLYEIYKIKLSIDLLVNSDTFLFVKTPTFLIAEHSREQEREYREIDRGFVDYLQNLDAVQLDLIQGYYRGVVLSGAKMKAILLRDGKRVNNLGSLPTYQGKYVFASEIEKQVSESLEQAQVYLPETPTIGMSMEELEKTLRDQGYTEDQIRLYTGFGKQYIQPSNSTSSQTRSLIESDNVFSLSELSKPGKYEIVYRTDPSSIRGAGDKEVRKTIDLKRFK